MVIPAFEEIGFAVADEELAVRLSFPLRTCDVGRIDEEIRSAWDSGVWLLQFRLFNIRTGVEEVEAVARGSSSCGAILLRRPVCNVLVTADVGDLCLQVRFAFAAIILLLLRCGKFATDGIESEAEVVLFWSCSGF